MNNLFKKHRIDKLLFRVVAWFMIVVLLCTAWASYHISSSELVSTNTHYQQQFLDKLNNEINTRLSTVEQISLSTSRENDLVAFLSRKGTGFERYQESRKVQQSFANLTYSMPLIQGIELYMDNPVRGEPYNYIQMRDIADQPDQVWAPLLEQSDFAWSREHRIESFQGEVPVLSFARKINYDNKNLGTLVIHVKASIIKEMLSGGADNVNRMVLDRTKQPLLAVGEQPDISGWLKAMEGKFGNNVQAESGMQLNDSLYVYSELTDYGWILLEVTPWKDITAGSVRLAATIAAIGLAALLLTLLLAHWLSRQFTKPIKQLVSAMGSYTVGAKQTALPLDYSNEFGSLFAGYRKQNERIEELYRSLQHRYEQQRKAEIEAMQANINPHFLYNTLDQMNWMAIARGQDEMSRILELMGRMFRIGLSNGAAFIRVAEEIVHIECYLEIQQLRWESGFSYTIEAAEEVNKLYLPKMLLQPFVENSVMHGFNGRHTGHVDIRISAVPEGLLLVVEDNGVGLRHSGDAAAGSKRKTGGYGIRNVRERIEAYFGSPYGISLADRPEGGARAEIRLPRLTRPPGDASPAEPASGGGRMDALPGAPLDGAAPGGNSGSALDRKNGAKADTDNIPPLYEGPEV